MTWSWQTSCPDASRKNYLNVLTINLLFSKVANRNLRLSKIADFVQTYKEPVDIILLQEVVESRLLGTTNSALGLKNLLAKNRLEYDLHYQPASGIPGVLTGGNAILSRYKILIALSKRLPYVAERILKGLQIPLRRKVMMARIGAPGLGKITVYNTQLSSFCNPKERFEQTTVLLNFIRNVEGLMWIESPVILGGDFNTDLNNPDDKHVYDLIINEGFTDAYAIANECHMSCSGDEGHGGYTYAVPDNPYAINLFRRIQESPKRIDYIFVKGLEVLHSAVVFKSGTEDDPWVSDHSGVLTKIQLIPPSDT